MQRQSCSYWLHLNVHVFHTKLKTRGHHVNIPLIVIDVLLWIPLLQLIVLKCQGRWYIFSSLQFNKTCDHQTVRWGKE
jgi:hypothetical protein